VWTLAAADRAAAQFTPVGTLNSITLSPSTPGIGVGQQQPFNATGNFDGGTRQLGGNGSAPIWRLNFPSGIDVSACADPPVTTSYCCQSSSLHADGTFSDLWGNPPLVQASGTLTPLAYHADLSCVQPMAGAPTGSVDAVWTGTQYDGTFSFTNSGNVSVVGLTWSTSDPSIAIVDARGVATALAPGTTTITATFGATCWPGEPEPAQGCRGTVIAATTLTVTGESCAPPVINRAWVEPTTLWPPNHKLVPVVVGAEVTNACDRPVQCGIISIASSEPADANGDGSTEPDWVQTSSRTALLRAERSGGGPGRLYTLVLECTNGSDSSERAVVVSVPHNR
jgi:hypothetical protein